MDRLNHVIALITRHRSLQIYVGCVLLVLIGAVGVIALGFNSKDQDETRRSSSEVLQVFDETVNGYRQVYSVQGSVKSYLTDDQANNTNAVTDGTRVAWTKEIDGANQVFVHDLKTKATLQLSFYGSNTDVAISKDLVAWVGNNDGQDQVYVFDGVKVAQVSDSVVARQPVLDGEKLAFIQSNGKDWRIVLMNNKDQSRSVVSVGQYESVAFPRFVNGTIQSGITQN